MNYFELFAGIGVGSYAIQKVFPDAYCAGFSEIHQPAITIYEKNFPNHDCFGDIKHIPCVPGGLDLLIGGSPCQDLSIQKANRKGLEGDKSKLFYEFVRILEINKPKYFVLENVASMSKESRDTISKILGVEPVKLSSDWFGYQKRDRLYWANFPIREPTDKNGLHEYELVRYSSSGRGKGNPREHRHYKDGKANTLLTSKGCQGQSTKTLWDGGVMTPEQCEHLSGLPTDWTKGVSDSERFRGIGNAFDAFTMVYIMQELKACI